jgi:signal transduction histidine kinase
MLTSESSADCLCAHTRAIASLRPTLVTRGRPHRSSGVEFPLANSYGNDLFPSEVGTRNVNYSTAIADHGRLIPERIVMRHRLGRDTAGLKSAPAGLWTLSMSQLLPEFGKSQHSNSADWIRRWTGYVAIATAVGAAYFLVGRLTMLGAVFQPDKSTLFWPAAGISSGVLIALGPRQRWPAVAGIVAGEAVTAQVSWNYLPLTAALAICDAAEALTIAGLVLRYFGNPGFALDRPRNVFGLLGAAVVGAAAPSLAAAIAKRLLLGPSIAALATWQRWFTGDVVGIVIVAPLVIEVTDTLRHPPTRREYIEGACALLSLALVTSIIVSLSQETWRVLLPVAWPFPILLWLAGRSRPVFAVAGAFVVSSIIVWTATFGIGHFGDGARPLGDRAPEAQMAILFLAVSAYVLAALFAERRESEAVLARANAMLERERNSKLMNVEVTAAAIAHELRQPLAAIVANADASLGFLTKASPDLIQVKEALNDIIADGRRTSDAFDGIRALFRNVNERREQIDVNEICREVLRAMRIELNDHGITVVSELSPEMPPIQGNRGQLQQVIFNLAHNAVEAMGNTTGQPRVLRLITQREDRRRIVVRVQDTGPGIAPEQLEQIFNTFATTKPQGTGLGLAICRVIVDRHGGELSAFSDGKDGALLQSTFRSIRPTQPGDWHRSTGGNLFVMSTYVASRHF